MAHFAELDSENKVLRIIRVSDADILDENGEESEALGVAFVSTCWVKIRAGRSAVSMQASEPLPQCGGSLRRRWIFLLRPFRLFRHGQ